MGVIESSPHYLEILRLMLDGVSSRNIEKHLLRNYGEKISHSSINNFRNNNLDIEDLIKQVELQQQTVKEGKVNILNDKLNQDRLAEQMIIKEINTGIDVLNLIRDALSVANNQNIFHEFFESTDVTLKDKMQVLIQLSKLDLDWRKNTETNVNFNSQVIDLSSIFKDDLKWD